MPAPSELTGSLQPCPYDQAPRKLAQFQWVLGASLRSRRIRITLVGVGICFFLLATLFSTPPALLYHQSPSSPPPASEPPIFKPPTFEASTNEASSPGAPSFKAPKPEAPTSAPPTFDGKHGNGLDGNPLIVDVSYGKYQGVALSSGVSQWLGMRYAGPPTGANRFAAPVPPEPFSGVKMADQLVPGCFGVGPKTDGTAEDCLSIDVYAPSNASAASKLPVYVFIQGGGNQASVGHLNATALLQTAGLGMVFASFTYRTGAYGFLASSEVQANASLNNGYKDQRQALQWVKNHIANFGGDPDFITMGGQSAGGGAAVSQLAAYGQRNNGGLFHAALIQSPSMPPVRTVPQQQFQYDDLVNRLGCSGNADTLNCLRAVPHAKFLAQVAVLPFPDGSGKLPRFGWNPVIDHDFIPEAPVSTLSKGNFVQVPTIIGHVTNEGSIFAPGSLSDVNDTWDFLQATYPGLNSTAKGQFTALYNLSDSSPGPYWKHGAAAYGELRYICSGTQVADMLLSQGNTAVWRYRFDVGTPAGIENGFGVSHGAEVGSIFPGGWTHSPDESVSSIFGPQNVNIGPVMQNYWSSFVLHHDPSIRLRSELPQWTRWSASAQQLHLVAENPSMETTDPGQLARCKYLASIAAELEQ